MARFGYLKASLFALLALAFTTNAQSPAPTPQVIAPTAVAAPRVAGDSTLYCAGYIRFQKLPHMPEIVGALEEQEQRTYADGDVVYLNAGSQQGIKEGQNFQIIRPRSTVKGVHKQKRGFLGIYIQEVGQLRVFKVNDNTSAARITFTCDPALLGDLLAPVPDRESPLLRADGNLDQFAEPSGKQIGRLMMARDSREMVTRNDIVYIDLGGEDKINRGDYPRFTVHSAPGTSRVSIMKRVRAIAPAVSRAIVFGAAVFRVWGRAPKTPPRLLTQRAAIDIARSPRRKLKIIDH
jgi:hypothetical protein